jgi:hypothetical protein
MTRKQPGRAGPTPVCPEPTPGGHAAAALRPQPVFIPGKAENDALCRLLNGPHAAEECSKLTDDIEASRSSGSAELAIIEWRQGLEERVSTRLALDSRRSEAGPNNAPGVIWPASGYFLCTPTARGESDRQLATGLERAAGRSTFTPVTGGQRTRWTFRQRRSSHGPARSSSRLPRPRHELGIIRRSVCLTYARPSQ